MAFDPDAFLADFEQETAQTQIEPVAVPEAVAEPPMQPATFSPDEFLKDSPVEKTFAQRLFAESPTLETIAAIGTGLPAQVASGFAGMAGAVLPGEEGQGERFVEATQEFLQYDPQTQESKEQLQAIAEAPGIKQLAWLMDKYTQGADYVAGMIGEESPETGAIVRGTAEIVPDLIGLLTGTKAAQVTAKTASTAAKGIENTVKTISGKPDIRVFDDSGLVTPEAMDVIKNAQQSGIDVDTVAQKEAVSALDERGLVSPDDLDVLVAASKQVDEQPLTALGMMENYNLFKSRGVPVTRANVTQGVDDWRYQQDQIKMDGDVSKMVAEQDRVLAELAREGKEQIGFIADDLPSTNESLFHTVNDIAETYDKAVTDAYKAARASAPGQKNIKLSGFVEMLKRNAGSENATGWIISSIRQELRNKGVSQKGFTAEGKIDVETAEEIRQHLNRLYASSGTTDFGKQVIHQLKEAIDNDVAGVVGEDLFKPARIAKQDFHKLISRGKVNKWEASQKSFIEDILTGKIQQDKIADRLGKLPPEQFDDAKDFFLNRSGDAGISAWNNYKASVLDQAIEKARGALSGAQDGQRIESFNSKAFERVFKPLKISKASKEKGAPTKYEAIFNESERALIDDIIAIGELRRPRKAVALGSGPTGLAVMDLIETLIDRPVGVSTAGMVNPVNSLRKGVKARQDKRREEKFLRPEVVIEEKVMGAN